MTQQTLYKVCPLCDQGQVDWQATESSYRCTHCGLALKERTILGLFKKGRYGVVNFGQGNFALAEQGLAKATLTADALKVALGNVYPDEQLAEIAQGNLALLRPVRTLLAAIILEQLNEDCFLQVLDLRRGHGQPLVDQAGYIPSETTPRQGMDWQDEGNLFCTTNRLVFPSDRFTFIRTDRKLVAIQAFTDGLAVQRKGEEYATYFVGCYPHEAALLAAYVIAKVPALQQKLNQPIS